MNPLQLFRSETTLGPAYTCGRTMCNTAALGHDVQELQVQHNPQSGVNAPQIAQGQITHAVA